MRIAIIRMLVDIISTNLVMDRIQSWTHDHRGRYICVSNVHMCMEVFDNKEYAKIVNNSDLVVPDGRPVFWAQRLLGHGDAAQVRGEDLMLAICRGAELNAFPVGIFGSTEIVLTNLMKTLKSDYPELDIAYSYSPPFRNMTVEEDRKCIEEIKSSNVKVLFVGLGCPRQEIWMAEHLEQLECTMLGVGAAFDFIAGAKQRAPRWMQVVGLEWLFRLSSEPKRLWKRYLIHNTRFVWKFALQCFGKKYT